MSDSPSKILAPLHTCGLRHWSTEPEKCKFWEAPPAPVAQPRQRFAKAKGETKPKPETNSNVAETNSKRGGKRTGAGRPSDGKPWDAAGLSKAAYYRQRGK